MSDFSYSTSLSFDDYIARIDSMRANPIVQTPTISETLPPVSLEQAPDVIELSTKKEYDGPKISFFRLAFGRLTDEQIDAVNKSRRLPKNAKINSFGSVKNDIFHITRGTRTLPEGYELRKNIFGFTKLVLIDSEGLFLKKKAGGDAEMRKIEKAEKKAEKIAAKIEKKSYEKANKVQK